MFWRRRCGPLVLTALAVFRCVVCLANQPFDEVQQVLHRERLGQEGGYFDLTVWPVSQRDMLRGRAGVARNAAYIAMANTTSGQILLVAKERTGAVVSPASLLYSLRLTPISLPSACDELADFAAERG